jgi:hypothetical protein
MLRSIPRMWLNTKPLTHTLRLSLWRAIVVQRLASCFLFGFSPFHISARRLIIRRIFCISSVPTRALIKYVYNSRSGARGGAVRWDTALAVGRSRVRFPMLPLEFFIGIILPTALRPRGRLSLWEKWVPGKFSLHTGYTISCCVVRVVQCIVCV